MHNNDPDELSGEDELGGEFEFDELPDVLSYDALSGDHLGVESDCVTSEYLYAGDVFSHDACVIEVVRIIDTNQVEVDIYPLHEGKVNLIMVHGNIYDFKDFQVPFRIYSTMVFYSTSKFAVFKVCDLTEPVEPPVGGYIGDITYEIEKSIGMDEITFTIPITNIGTKGIWVYVNLYDQSGKFIDSEPDLIRPSIGPGITYPLRVSSKLKTWHIGTVQGQKVKFELKSKSSLLTGYKVVDTKEVDVETYPPIEPPLPPGACTICIGPDLYKGVVISGGVCEPIELIESNSISCGYEPPVEPPIEPPVELPITPEEAAAGIAAGKQYWIKSTWPWFDLLPGLPYFVGIPILPGFRISETM